MLLSFLMWIGKKNGGILNNRNWLSVHKGSLIGYVISFLLSNLFKDFIGYPLPYWFSCSIAWVSHHHNDQWYMVLTTTMTNEIFTLMLLKCKKKMALFNGRLPKLGFFLAQLCLDTQVRGNIGKNVSFSSSLIARKIMVEMLFGAPQWEIPQAWFVSCVLAQSCLHTPPQWPS